MDKRKIPVYQVSGEYADCLEKAFCPGQIRPEGAASAEGEFVRGKIVGAMGNTPLPSSNLGRVSEDTVHLSVWVDWGSDRDGLFARLHRCQLESRGHAELVDEDGEDSIADEDYAALMIDNSESYGDDTTSGWGGERYLEGHGKGWFEFGGCVWKVLPHGMGGKDGRSYFPYVIASGGVLIGFRRDSHETVSNMWVEMGSIPLAMNDGLTGVWGELKRMFKAESVTVIREIVSRVDMYADFDACDVSEFCRRFNEGMKVTRARKIGNYAEDLNTATYLVGLRFTGFSMGTNIKLRCYDKRYELEKDPVKWGVFADRYNGIPEVLTRIEFQLRRVALKEFLFNGLDRIDGVDSYLAARDHLWKYLTEDWFRLTDEKVDAKNKNQSKASTWDIWRQIQDAAGHVVKEIFRHRRPAKVDMEHLYKMALGCMCKIAIWEKGKVETANEVIAHFVEKVKAHGFRDFWDVMERHAEEMMLKVGHFGDGSSGDGVAEASA